MYFNIFESRYKKKSQDFYSVYIQMHFICALYCVNQYFQLEMLPVAIVLAIPGSHDDACCARPEFIIALYYEAKIFCVCKQKRAIKFIEQKRSCLALVYIKTLIFFSSFNFCFKKIFRSITLIQVNNHIIINIRCFNACRIGEY